MSMSTGVEAPGPVVTLPDAPPAFHVMAKPTGAICNLDCEYCFFLSKELLYPGSRFRMAEELQDIYIRQLLEAHARAPEVVVAWQGGEPTIMGLEFFRRSVELQEEYAKRGSASSTRCRRTERCSMTSGERF
jgi:serine-type anaerobic sulfatase-maturating enzyme